MSTTVISNVLNVDTFWTWAVAQWSDSILAAEMMALQEEHDCVVLELLLMGWLGRQHWAVSQGAHRQLANTASSWLNGVVIPLRRTRRSWREIDDLEIESHVISISIAMRAASRPAVSTVCAHKPPTTNSEVSVSEALHIASEGCSCVVVRNAQIIHVRKV